MAELQSHNAQSCVTCSPLSDLQEMSCTLLGGHLVSWQPPGFQAQSNEEAGTRSMATENRAVPVETLCFLSNLWPRQWQFLCNPRILSVKNVAVETRQPPPNPHTHTGVRSRPEACLLFGRLTLFIAADNGGKWKYRKQLYPCLAPALTWWERSSPAMLFSVSPLKYLECKDGVSEHAARCSHRLNPRWTWGALVNVAEAFV